MKEIKLEKVNEILYETILDNNFKIILYPTTKSKNFYICLTTRFGAKTLKYKKDNKIKNIYPGTAHFLEHKVVNLQDKKRMKKIEDLGSSPNAYTTYNNTTYELYGTNDIKENINILFDMVSNFSVTKESVENEKGIISEEIDMIDDDVYTQLNHMVNQNLFIKSSYKHLIGGTKEDIKKIDKKYLEEIYNTFYDLSNMFIVITGNFDKDEVEKHIIDLVKKIKTTKQNITVPKIKEPDEIKSSYVEKSANVELDKLSSTYKININNFKRYNEKEIKAYFMLLLNGLLGNTSEFLDKCKKEELIQGSSINYNVYVLDDHLIIKIVVNTNKPKIFLEQLNKIFNNLKLDEKTFERKKKVWLSSYILTFEDIESINMNLTFEETLYNTLPIYMYKLLNDLNYKDFNKIISKFKNNNNVVGRLYKE